MQDNFYFREPETQRMLLDILFIYSKLNPDIGYRQGMHELLAPLLWVVHQDAIDQSTVTALDRQADGAELMLDILDHKHREADAFSLFCAVMQTAKSFYEMGDNRDSSPIITKSRRIHDDLLGIFDSELALHLQVAGVLPQIYAIRWIRLLFGREFDFKDVLRIWDILFAENLRSDIIDLTCVSMLLRTRWTLVEADYSEAITTLTHVKLPGSDEDPRDLVRDAIIMDKSRTAETGATLIQKYSGRRPKVQQPERTRLSLDQTPTRRGSRTPQYRPSPSASPARFSGPQRQLESLFNDVSGGIKSRTEGWNVSKAVRGAVGEMRRNMSNLQAQAVHSRQSSVDIHSGAGGDRSQTQIEGKLLEQRLTELEGRNKALAKMLDAALDSLRASKTTNGGSTESAEESFNISLAKIQFVSVYLSDPEIPLPLDDLTTKREEEAPEDSQKERPPTTEQDQDSQGLQVPTHNAATPSEKLSPALSATKAPRELSPSPQIGTTGSSPAARPSLADSSFSFMLGEGRHRSSFVTSVSNLPEERRSSEPKKQLSVAEQKQRQRKDPKAGGDVAKTEGQEEGDDGFTMSSLRGGPL
jgi:TBC1 domain family member 5